MLIMLAQDTIFIKWHYNTRKYYEGKGYIFTNWGDEFEVKISDLPPNSDIKIPVLCDYCLKEGKETVCWKMVKEYNKTKNKKIIKDCCDNHKHQKVVDSNKNNYGINSTAMLPEVREKYKKTMLKNHGVMYSGQSPELLQKMKDTMQERYEVDYAMQSEILKNKMRQALYKNGTCKTSKQQKYLCDLLNGELNYPISYCSLDIAFLDENKYIEYNGSGHDLNVKYGRLTEKEFKNKEIKRDYYLKSIGWSKITIISLKDFLPQDDKIIEMINYAKEYLNTGHSWIIFDIDNKLIESSQFNYTYDFGELRKVKKRRHRIKI